MAVLRGVRWYHGPVLICISPIVRDAEHLFRCFIWPPGCLLWTNAHLDLWSIFANGMIFHILEINSLFLNSFPNFFPPFRGFLFFSLVYSFPSSAEVFEVRETQLNKTSKAFEVRENQLFGWILIFHYSKSGSKRVCYGLCQSLFFL